MRCISKLSLMAITPILTLGLVFSGNALGAYAEAYNNIAGQISFVDANGNPVLPPNFYIRNTTPLSSAKASINLVGVVTGGNTALDAPPANAAGSDPTRSDNAFDTKGPLGSTYSGSDSAIFVRQTDPYDAEQQARCTALGFPPTGSENVSCFQVTSIAESNVTQDTDGADSDSQTASLTSFHISVPARLVITVKADPFMRVKLGPLEGTGSVALSEITTTASITDADGNTVFDWGPNGELGSGISGGSELSDPVSLNSDLQTSFRSSDFVFPSGLNPTDAPDGDTLTGHFQTYQAVSDLLPPGDYTINLAQETDVGVLTAIEVAVGECRMTGGNATVSPAIGIDNKETWTYAFDDVHAENYDTGYWVTTGGQINAPSGNHPPSGHWVHAQHGGVNGSFSFHAGTSSAPDGTQISTVECADPGWCVQARCAPFKQLFWTGIGNFANQHFEGVFPGCDVVPTRGNQGSQHYVRVMIGDFGENDRPTREASLVDGNPDTCDWAAKLQAAGYPGFPGPYTAADAVLLDSAPDDKFFYKDGQVCDKCPDYYQIEIHCTTDPSSLVIYNFEGFLESGNYQIHPLTGEQCPASDTELVQFPTTVTKTNNGKNK